LESCASAMTALNQINQEVPLQTRLARVMIDDQENALRIIGPSERNRERLVEKLIA